MIDPVVESKLTPDQRFELLKMRVHRPDVDQNRLASLMVESTNEKPFNAVNLLKATEMMGPFAVDAGQKIWHYSQGVWLPDGAEELGRRVTFCTGSRRRIDHVNQVASIIKSRSPQINGLGPNHLINCRNGMLNWKTLELVKHDSKYFSTYQLNTSWNSNALCPTINRWMASTFDPDIVKLLWQVIGVTIHPGMGFQKIVVLLGDGLNGKGTFLRLCQSFLPDSAFCSIDPNLLGTNRFASADLFGKTANICGDIERLTLNSTAEIKKITGGDTIRGERKNEHAFYFLSEATLLYSGNKMPESRDTSPGWYRRWVIIPINRRIEGVPDPTINQQLAKELEGALVQAVMGLREAMEQGDYDEPEICKEALHAYKYSNNTSAFFINEKLDLADSHKTPLSRTDLYDDYLLFCKERDLEPGKRHELYAMLKQLGGPHITSRWAKKSTGAPDRGFAGIQIKPPNGDPL
jgi:putative DNA primase/helicase